MNNKRLVSLDRIREFVYRASEYSDDFDPGYMPEDFLLKLAELIEVEVTIQLYQKSLGTVRLPSYLIKEGIIKYPTGVIINL